MNEHKKNVSRIVSQKITVTEEIRFRVSFSLSMLCFDSLTILIIKLINEMNKALINIIIESQKKVF